METIQNNTRSTVFPAWLPRSWIGILTAAGLLVIFIAAMAAVQFATPDMPDNDGYYHIKIAQIMRQEGLKPDFPWLPLTILNAREYYDHHFLYHVALIPFTFGDLRLGAKWSAVFFAALAFLSVWWLLRSQRVPYAGLWSLGLLAVSEAFLFRMSITRAQSLSLAVLALGMYLLLANKHRWLVVLGFVYVWLYNAFPLLLLLTGVYSVALLLAERKLDLRPVVYAGLGIGLGLLINPYFPHNIVFIFHHLFPKLTEATAVSVGSEWYPYNTTQILENSLVALLAFLAGTFALGVSGRKMDTRTLFSMLMAVLFGAMLFQARRFIEYFPAGALIFAAFAWAPLLAKQPGEGWKFEAAALLPRGYDRIVKVPNRIVRWLPVAVLTLVIGFGSLFTLRAAAESIKSSKPYQTYAAASAWLVENTPAGSRVFQTDWDDFPRLFFYNTHNTYLVGLDPTYMQIYDPGLYDEWVAITRGRVEQPSKDITSRFASLYILTDLDHGAFIRQADADPGLELVYEDHYARIYRVVQ
jgi:hypothetical protein